MTTDTQITDVEIKRVIASIDHLKPLPATITRALQLMENPDVSINQVAAAISADQALAAQILKQANSAYYGFNKPASTLPEAVMRLGLRRTKAVLFTLTYSGLLERKVDSYNLGRGELWRHSVSVAKIAQLLSEYIAYPAPDEAYIGGLLHDIGKLLLAQHFAPDWEQLLAVAQEHHLPLVEAEEQVMGLNHAQVGAELAGKWGLPPRMVEAIAYHHVPMSAKEAPKLVAIVHIANTICLRLKIGLHDDVFMPDPSMEILHKLSLLAHEVNTLTYAAEQWLSRAVELPR